LSSACSPRCRPVAPSLPKDTVTATTAALASDWTTTNPTVPITVAGVPVTVSRRFAAEIIARNAQEVPRVNMLTEPLLQPARCRRFRPDHVRVAHDRGEEILCWSIHFLSDGLISHDRSACRSFAPQDLLQAGTESKAHTIDMVSQCEESRLPWPINPPYKLHPSA